MGFYLGIVCKFVLVKLGEIMGGSPNSIQPFLLEVSVCQFLTSYLYRSRTNTTDYLRVGTVLCQTRICLSYIEVIHKRVLPTMVPKGSIWPNTSLVPLPS